MKRKSGLPEISNSIDHHFKKLKSETICEIPQKEEHQVDHEQELVKLILSDNLLKIPQGLKDQLGGNKVKVLHINFHKIDYTLPKLDDTISYITTVTTNQLNNLIIAITTKNQCYVFDSECKSWKLKFKLPLYSSYLIDSQFENVYIGARGGIIKKFKILDHVTDYSTESPIWESKISSHYEMCCAKSKNELYIRHNINTIYVMDLLNGSKIREIKLNQPNYTIVDVLHVDEKEGQLYLLFKDILNGYEQLHYLILKDEKSGIEIKIDTFDEAIVSIIPYYEHYFISLTRNGEAYLYEKKTNNLLHTFTVSKYLNVAHFDNNFKRLYFSPTHSADSCNVAQFIIETSVENVPLTRESCLSLAKLSVKFPSLIIREYGESVMPECLQFLKDIDFGNKKLWFFDKEITKCFQLDFENEYFEIPDEHDDVIVIGESNEEMEDEKYQVCIYVRKSEVSNNYDFPVYLHYKESLKDGFLKTKSLKFSEFISKLTLSESIIIQHNRSTYLINFEMIYEELIQKSIIHPQTKLIDNILVEKYRKMMCGVDKEDYFELARKFNSSTIKFDNTLFLQMDLIALAIDCCSEISFFKIK
ncbi:predicted protein [Naegleria gruberi]|uniref:Predicted protein n=1 Tax=Naegleria gruberi TaxID=5762 RepID=D2VU28_NAEGR|nr:uncharacterized protein NAEGRDRAFT_72515 [Naegleria gruberi]EFC39617.1 predicted protein [Naegleria gruberi]|eukprot:XP_002672361.1 predicted protein [Naegleria gruberi strain NEG-M]